MRSAPVVPKRAVYALAGFVVTTQSHRLTTKIKACARQDQVAAKAKQPNPQAVTARGASKRSCTDAASSARSAVVTIASVDTDWACHIAFCRRPPRCTCVTALPTSFETETNVWQAQIRDRTVAGTVERDSVMAPIAQSCVGTLRHHHQHLDCKKTSAHENSVQLLPVNLHCNVCQTTPSGLDWPGTISFTLPPPSAHKHTYHSH